MPRRWPLAGGLLLLAAFVLLAAQSASRPYLFDEANFLFQAQAIAETGVPYANMGYLGDRGAVTTRLQYGVWHPPLYLYLLGLNYKLFGGAEGAARSLGILCMLVSGLLVFALGRQVGGRGRPAALCGLVALALFLVSPLVVQSAVIVDIDGTVLLPLLCLWALAYLRWETALTPRRVLLLALLLALALWAKTTTPLLLPLAALLHQTWRGRWRSGLAVMVGALAVGCSAFLASWWLVATALGLPFAMPFEWNAWQLGDASSYTRSWLGDWGRMRDELAPALVWASPYFAGLFGVVAFTRVAGRLRRHALPVDFLLLAGGLVFLAYFIKLAANFPKYDVGMLPFWAAATAWWLVQAWRALAPPARLLAPAILLALAAYHLGVVRDRWMWTNALVWEPLPLLLAVILFALAVAAGLLPRWHRLGAPLGVLLALLYVGWAAGVDYAQAEADYSTNYYYGTRGQREAAALLDSTGYRGPWIGPKEVGWYAGNQYYIDSDTFWWLVIARGFHFEGRVLDYDVPVVLVWTMDPTVSEFFARQLAARYVEVGHAGDYALWLRRDRLPALTLPAAAPDPSRR